MQRRLICFYLSLAVIVLPNVAYSADDRVDYAKDIKPLLKARCYTCHGVREQSGELRLDTGNLIRKGGSSGASVVAGQAGASLLIQRISATDEDERMPPEGKPLTASQIRLLATWINQGAKSPADEQPESDPLDHWAFQPPVRPAIPVLADVSTHANPIDAFVNSRLQESGIAPSPPADRATLIRRLSLDLLGLPPTSEAVQRFVDDARPDAWERLVEQMLMAPAFGERWGRHWLDLARYADSNGYEDDRQRPDAWRFRDWVIDAVNADMPFDKFTVHQLAGDLLPQASYDEKVAAGFHRMTLSNEGGADAVEEEFRILAVKDRVDTTGAVWLGLSFGCAKCHSHKYDPISHAEYYRLFAFFNNADHASISAPSPAERYVREYEEDLQAYHARLADIRKRIDAYERNTLHDKLTAWRMTVAADNELARKIQEYMDVSALKRSTRNQLKLVVLLAPIDPQYAEVVGNELLNAGNNRPLPPSTHAMTFTATTRPSHVHLRGSFLNLGEAVSPGTPAFLPTLHPRNGTPDRLDLARWIVDKRNPLTARVAVNRIWSHLFGRGIVATLDGFGLTGEAPSHPELLDWLAVEFMDRGWSTKSMIRLMVTSSTYRQSSHVRPELETHDPENALLARQVRRRLEAEAVRDAALSVAGLLNRQIGGPPFQPPLPAGLTNLDEIRNERFMEPSGAQDRFRRGAYINIQRMLMLPMLQAFDGADANGTCARRDESNTPIQALTLLNDPTFYEAAQKLGLRIVTECDADVYARIDYAFRLCLGRRSNNSEVLVLENLYRDHLAIFHDDPQLVDDLIGSSELSPTIDRRDAAAWIGLARSLLNLDEFITRE